MQDVVVEAAFLERVNACGRTLDDFDLLAQGFPQGLCRVTDRVK
jgi:hypothetical protein